MTYFSWGSVYQSLDHEVDEAWKLICIDTIGGLLMSEGEWMSQSVWS